MKLRRIVYDMYNIFVERFHDLDEYSCEQHNNLEDVVVNCLMQIHKRVGLQSVGPLYVYRYLVWQFNYWEEKNVVDTDRITLTKVFGVPSVDRFIDRSPNFSWYHAYRRMSRYGIDEHMLDKYKLRSTVDYTKLNQVEELEKDRFFNQDRGFANCMEATTLYNDRSDLCSVCNHSSICKKVLKSNFIGIYVDRGYHVQQ